MLEGPRVGGSRARVRFVALFGALIASGCALLFDTEEPQVPLLGTAPSMDALARFNLHGLVDGSAIVQGADKAYWVAMQPATPLVFRVGGGAETSASRDHLYVVRFPPADPSTGSSTEAPSEEFELSADRIYIYWRAFYLINPDPAPADFDPTSGTRLRIVSAGQTDPPSDFVMPPGNELLLVSGVDDIFVYFPRAAETTRFQIRRRDGTVLRELAVPPGVDPKTPLDKGAMFFAGRYFLTRDAEGNVVSHEIYAELDHDLGQRPRSLIADSTRLYSCTADGLLAVPLSGAAQLVLDPDPCELSESPLYVYGTSIYYRSQGQIRRVRRDGQDSPTVVFEDADATRIVQVGQAARPGTEPPELDEVVLYSRDPSTRYVNGAGDGWLGGWRFMERGRAAYLSRDGKRVRWLEHAARNNGVGDLRSAELPASELPSADSSTPRGPWPEPLRIARNVRDYTELSDGRILAAANNAFRGVHNRIIVVDEERREARWVADAASDYQFIPGSNDLLVDRIAGPDGYDLVRVPIPPRVEEP